MESTRIVRMHLWFLLVAGLWLFVSPATAQDITSNLVAHWALDDGSGTTALDSTANNYDGTIAGAPSWTTPSKVAGGLDFESSDGADSISAGTFDVSGSGITLAAWIYPESGSTDHRIVIKSTTNDTSTHYWALVCDLASEIDFRVHGGVTYDKLAAPGVVTAGHWYHVVATYNGTTMTIYVDGVAVASKTHAAGGAVRTDATFPVTLGDSPVGGRAFDGQMDDVRVYERALTATEVWALFNHGWGSRDLLLVTANSGSYTAQEQLRKKQFEDWDYKVSAVWDLDSQAAFDAALVGMNVAYVSEEISSTNVSYKLRETTVGVVFDEAALADEFGLSTSSGDPGDHSTLTITDNSHYITSPFSIGALSYSSPAADVQNFSGTLASGMQLLGDWTSSSALGAVETGGSLANTYNSSSTAFGRRVGFMHGGGFDWDDLTSDGLTIFQRALEWASVDKLAGHWKLDETSGTTAADESTSGNDGTYTNGPVLAETAPYGYAANFDGSNDRVVVADDPSLQMTTAVTMAAWVKPVQTGNTERMVINKEGEYEMALTNTGELKWAYKNTDPGWSWHYTGAIVPDDEWSHIAVTYDNGIVKSYVNGQLVDTYNGSGTLGDHYPTYNELWIGGRSNNPTGASFGGLIDDARVYHSALTDAEVAELYGLLGWWKLDETSGTTATDSSGLGNHGTLAGTANWSTDSLGNGVFDFDGSTNYFSVANTTPLQITDSITLVGWIKADAWGTGYYADIMIRKGEDNPNNYQLAIVEGRVHLSLDDSDGSGIRGDTTLMTGRWYHVAATWDGSTAKIYLNGQLDAVPTAHTGTLGTDTRPLYLGGRLGTDLSDGRQRDLRLYNRALSHADIAELYGLIGLWDFDEGAGSTIADSSGIGNDATFNTGTPTWIDGIYGSALEFDGTNDAMTTTDFDPPSAGAVSYWFRSDGPPTSRQRPWGLGGDFEVWQDTDGLVSFDVSTDGFQGGFISDEPLDSAGRWYHLVAQYDCDDDSYEIYLNGELHKSGISTWAMVQQAANQLSFGTRTGSIQRFAGALDEFRIYNRKISVAEINDLYGRLAYWKLDETSGSVAVDSTVHANDGSYTGIPTLGIDGAFVANTGTAVALDGTSEYVATSKSLLNDLTAFTMLGWIRVDSLAVDQSFFGQNDVLELGISESSGEVVLRSEAWGDFVSIDNQLPPGKWTHVAVTGDGADLKIYLNGNEAATDAFATASYGSSAQSFKLGEGVFSPTGDYLDGRLDDVQVFDRALKPEELFGIYKGGRPAGIRILKWVEAR